MSLTVVDRPSPAAAFGARPVRVPRRVGTRRARPIEKGRVIALVALAAAVVGGFAGAMTLLSGLAGPPPRPIIVMNTGAATWPDLRDGVPALARPAETTSRAAAEPPRETPAAAAVPPAPPVVSASIAPVAAPQPPMTAERARQGGRSLPMENATLVAPVREAALIASASRVTGLVRPLASETVKARTAAASAFTALESAETTASVAAPAKEVVAHREPVKPRVKTVSAKPVRAPAAGAPAAAATTETADADETEVLGLKIPSLSATGRKLREVFGDSASAASK